MTHDPRPPRWATRLLQRAVPDGRSRDGLIGDLEELYGERRAGGGRLRADLWYARQALLAAARCHPRLRRIGKRMRNEWGFPTMDSVWQDLRYGARMLRRSPLFTLVAVLSTACGLAAGTAMFALLNAVVFRPLGVGDGRHLYRIYTENRGGSLYGSPSYDDYEAFRALEDVFAETCATTEVRATVVANGASDLHRGEIVSRDCFAALRLTPERGRFFTADAASWPTGAPPLVISHAMWVRRFARAEELVGRGVQINGADVTVVAVAPAGFAGTSFDGGSDFWAPVDLAPAVFPPGSGAVGRQRRFAVFARLRAGVEQRQAEAALSVVAARLRAADEASWANENGATRRVTFRRETEARFADSPSTATGMAAAVISAVLIIVALACVNLATMQLARGASRARELSIRIATGASRARILRQLATESLLIAIIGGAAAIGAVAAGIQLFNAYRPDVIPAFDVALDGRVVLFNIALASVATVLFGLAPAAHTLRVSLSEGLKGGGGWIGVRRLRLGARELLIVLQVSVSMALLLVSTMFVRAFMQGPAQASELDGRNVAVVAVHLDAIADAEVPQVIARLLEAVGTVPGFDRATLAAIVPMTGTNRTYGVSVEGQPDRRVYGNVVAPGYFGLLGIPLLEGRDFDGRDRAGAPGAVIVSEAFAQSFWGTAHATGRMLQLHDEPLQIVGVVANTHYLAFAEPYQPLLYLPVAQAPEPNFIIHARAQGGPGALVALDRALGAADRRVGLEHSMSLRTRMEAALVSERLTQWIGGVVGVLQLGLAMMALWGLVAYAVARRMPEMGVRLALGATPSGLVRLMVRSPARLITAGIVVGALAGAAGARLVQSMSVGLPPLDFIVVFPVAGAFALVAMLAAWWPARRAGALDPTDSLRRD